MEQIKVMELIRLLFDQIKAADYLVEEELPGVGINIIGGGNRLFDALYAPSDALRFILILYGVNEDDAYEMISDALRDDSIDKLLEVIKCQDS